jgi:FtsH-binding integral membrane protein
MWARNAAGAVARMNPLRRGNRLAETRFMAAPTDPIELTLFASMRQPMQPAVSLGMPVSRLGVDERAAFISRTYLHLLGAIALFVGIEVFLFTSGLAAVIAETMLSASWLLILGAFILVGWLATKTAHSSASQSMQYLALGGYVVAYALIFVPILYIANYYAPGAIESAAMVTVIGFTGLTAIAFFTRKDFSFLGGLLKWAGIMAIVAIGAALLFGFALGTWFSVAMVGLAGASILYTTSNMIHYYPEDRHVAASLELFGSVALMFYYVLMLFMNRD